MIITQPSQTQLTVSLPDKPATAIHTQLGMRYPDGTILWGYDHESVGGSIRFDHLDGEMVARQWRQRLTRRAEAASIQVSEYIEGHELVKRTIIIAVTEHEEVQP